MRGERNRIRLRNQKPALRLRAQKSLGLNLERIDGGRHGGNLIREIAPRTNT